MRLPLWRRLAISAFVVVNLATIAYCNLPDECHEAVDSFNGQRFGAMTQWRLRYAAWNVRRYAHLVGLDNRWQMFGRQSRFNWWYIVRGEYSDGETTRLVTLPIPSQSSRTWSQRMLFDMKETKLLLNVYRDEFARETMSRQFAREWPTHHGLPIRAVVWDLAHQYILPPDEAVRQQRLHDEHVYSQLLNRFEIPR